MSDIDIDSLPKLPTGKPHVSFSEIRNWKECPYRHKLTYVDKIDMFEPSPYLDFGTAVHEGCEDLLASKEPDREKLFEDIRKAWDEHGFDDPEWVARQPDWYKNKYAPLDEWIDWAENMWNDIPTYLDKEFPGWEYVDAEEMLYEPIEGTDVHFKGFIDGIIKVPKKRGKGHNIWLLDWKTANTYGWRRDKKTNILTTAQLILYKKFWSEKHGVPLKDIRCGFILLKRGAKPGKVCDIVTVSVGPKAIEKADKILYSMIKLVKKGFAVKNRNSCRYCPYFETEHCT